MKRFEVYLVNLEPTIGSEIKKVRPCLIVSPDVQNIHLRTVIVAPLTSTCRALPSRIPCHFQGKDGNILLHQLRTVDKARLLKKLGTLEHESQVLVVEGLHAMLCQPVMR